MDYEKKYNEALERARKIHDEIVNNEVIGFPGQITDIFPELRKSEDEEIRKDIIGGLMWQRDNLKSEGPHDNNLILPGFCLTVGEHLKYLDKQKGLDKMIVVSPEVWDNAISDAFENGKREGEKQKEQNDKNEERTDFTIYHPLKNGKGGYECIPYSFYGSLTSFSEDKDLIDFLRTCFYTKEECNEWIKQQEEPEPKEPGYKHEDYFCERCQANAFNAGRESVLKEQKPELVQQPPITYTYNSNASRDERLKAALLALLNSDLIKVQEGGYFTKQDLIEWVERIPTDKPAGWCDEDEKHLIWICRIIHGRVVNKELSLAEESELGKWIDKWINHEPQPVQKWDEFDKDCLKRAIWYVENPAPSVVKDTNLALWLESLPKRFNLKPKPAWSEEDEKKIHFLSRLIEFQVKDGEYCFGEGSCAISKQEAIEMLKSIRPCPSWKPSEEDKEMKLKILKYLSTRCSVEQFEEVEEWLNNKLK